MVQLNLSTEDLETLETARKSIISVWPNQEKLHPDLQSYCEYILTSHASEIRYYANNEDVKDETKVASSFENLGST